MNRITKLAIVDDHDLFRKGLALLLDAEEDMEVVLEAGTGLQLIQRIKGIQVDIVLMDIEMPEMDGLKATQQLQAEYPEVRVVFLSSHNEAEMILAAVEQGARGYLLKTSEPRELIDAVNSVMQNGFCFNEDISSLVLKGVMAKGKLSATFRPEAQLTTRELEVLQLILQELTNAEIAEKLFLSPRTVESYRQNMMAKIGARNSVGLVIYGLKNKLLDL